jgi:threonine dehydratase
LATTPLIKVKHTLGYGARVIQTGTILDDAAEEALGHQVEEQQ